MKESEKFLLWDFQLKRTGQEIIPWAVSNDAGFNIIYKSKAQDRVRQW